MVNRRKFIIKSSLGVSGVLLHSKLLAKPLNSAKVLPIVISTWDFGIAANKAAWDVLSKGGKAIDAIEAGGRVPEADVNNRSVGSSGYPDRDGYVTLDACIMDEMGNCGAVAAMEYIDHPISVARLVMEKTPHVLLVGAGATQFALANGFEKKELLTPESEKAWKQWLIKSEYKPEINIENEHFSPNKLPGNQFNHDTLGILAMDKAGNICGGCTTSGMAYKMHGRVGDSPVIGAGLYIDNEVGGATATGVGEEVMRNVGSFLVVELMRQGYSPEDACKEAVQRIINKKPVKARTLQVGFLAMNKNGEYGSYAIQKGFSYAVCTQEKQDLLVKGNSIF
ncbi:MAG: N(4)-(beta-N-acetylglucosaminyl)-L-asparaginase [Pelobium sp.]